MYEPYMIGKKFSYLTVEKFAYQETRKNFWQCRCDCGNTVIVRGSFMKSGLVSSCGCGIESVKEELNIDPGINIGQKVQFVPVTIKCANYTDDEKLLESVVGTIIYINKEHRYFTAEYEINKTKNKESFKFCDLGQVVTLIG